MTSYGVLQAQNVLDWAKAQTRNGAFSVAPGCTGVPDTAAWYAGSLLVNVPGSAWTLYLFNTTTREAICNFTVSGEWNGWISIATATKPQEFDLPLASAYTGQVKYLKTQENMVLVDINVGSSDGSEISNNNMTLATLPAGFRPSRVVYSDAVTLTSDAGTIVGIAQFWVDNIGKLNIRVPSGSYRIRGELMFLVAD